MPSIVTHLETRAPAKINLGLRIVGRRGDGYHLIDSLFAPLDLADELRVELERGRVEGEGTRIDLECSDAGDARIAAAVPRDASNLAVRAARAFLGGIRDAESAHGIAHDGIARVRIRLRKAIPAAAGLGGGSSDAAAVLRALSLLVPGGPQGKELATLALSLGADVPFFLSPGPARVGGIGERIEPFGGLPRLPVVLANPGISLSTAEVYRRYDEAGAGAGGGLTPSDPAPTMRALCRLGADPDALARLPGFTNDLEAAAVGLCPPVARLRDDLRESGALLAGMSGSGATVYGLFATEDEAVAACERLCDGPGAAPWSRVTWLRTAGPDATGDPMEAAKAREGSR